MNWFADTLLDWFDRHGRKHLPWQQNPTPYRVWVSEIMLQQTQVLTVVPYYQRFMDRFPAVGELAAAELDEVLHHWTGLGYYARGRNLHKAAAMIAGNGFPTDQAGLEALPGIGRSTAGAIRALAMQQHAAILDGNVKRVLARFHTVSGHVADAKTLETLWSHAEQHTPAQRTADYTQAIMDLGAMLCTRGTPNCAECPITSKCAAYLANRVSEFPHPRPKKVKPVRQARMYVITTPDGACLLEQRPNKGIWGGLWTPPERSADTSPDDICLEVGIHFDSVTESRVAPSFRHTFTHFHLDIEPYYLMVDSQPALIAEGERLLWYGKGQNQRLGLAAPAVKLLATLDHFELS